MKQILFFAAKNDLLPVLGLVVRQGPLNYTLMGNFRKSDLLGGISILESGTALPDLGISSGNSSSTSESFLVCERGTSINLRHFQGLDDERVCIDQLMNPDSVEFTPGGLWNEGVLIQGRIASASQSETSQELMKRYYAAITKAFTKIKAFYVGPNALSLLKNGKRLTSSEQSPREYDLVSTLSDSREVTEPKTQ